MDKQLENIGYSKEDPLRNSRLRLGFLGEEGDNGKRKTKRVPGIKKPREKSHQEKGTNLILSREPRNPMYGN